MNAEELCGKVLGTCTLQKVIGRGGMGAVYLAQQSRPRRQVAVKVLLPITTFQPQQHKAFLERFRRETDAAASLEHPNITPVHEYGELDGLAYLVMPYVSGGTLRDELDTEGKLPLTRVVSYLEQMAAALDFAHERKVVHRDIKPANILMTPEKRLLLTDFGLVKIITDGQKNQNPLSEVGMPMGTPDYMAPEQVVGGKVDARADIYSLGVLLYHMVAGTPPFQGETPMKVALQHLHTPPPLPRTYRPDLPPAAEQVILRSLAKRPTDRYLRARDLASAFRLALEAAGVQVDGSADAGNRRRGLFDPVWQSPMPASAHNQEQPEAAPQAVARETAARAAQVLAARNDIVAQTSMTLPSFSGILTEANIAAMKPSSAQPSALPGHSSHLKTGGVPETPNSSLSTIGLTPLPPTIGEGVRQAVPQPANQQTPLPPVAEPLQLDKVAVPDAEAGNKKMFMPPRLRLGHKTNLRGLHKGSSATGEISDTAPTMPRHLLSGRPLHTQKQSETVSKNLGPITRQINPVTGMQTGTTTTETLAQAIDKEMGEASLLRSSSPAATKQKSTGELPALAQPFSLLELIKTYKKTAALVIIVILIVLCSIIYNLIRVVPSTPATGSYGTPNSVRFSTTAIVKTRHSPKSTAVIAYSALPNGESQQVASVEAAGVAFTNLLPANQ
ncbi:serine/threonine-protein kinase [Dictyobacter kobayashii]|uniref:non-specific serine/threonine protein kinase n=1 Tax=Dictyobacter kobayashii TaxID=2014872 RepID=A0A402AFG1_9CHLR|nr:serine/threonine-protein kinase [Dictyobacter kobayashii]GCE17857.1 hypothetical protein KDK_16570 [Dictyobacter kobayashii]